MALKRGAFNESQLPFLGARRGEQPVDEPEEQRVKDARVGQGRVGYEKKTGPKGPRGVSRRQRPGS